VASRCIAGSLSAAESDSERVITSYLAANAFVLLLFGWLSSYFGRRNYLWEWIFFIGRRRWTVTTDDPRSNN
jgi:MFS family permease